MCLGFECFDFDFNFDSVSKALRERNDEEHASPNASSFETSNQPTETFNSISQNDNDDNNTMTIEMYLCLIRVAIDRIKGSPIYGIERNENVYFD